VSENAPKPKPKPPARALIQLRGVAKTYREGERSREVLRDIDLDITAGEALILLGRSGSGKSTLLNLLAGIETPDRGEILSCGERLDAQDEEERARYRRHQVGYVFQFFNLIPTLTVLENVLFKLELVGKRGADGQQRARDLIEAVGLGGREDTFPERLSGGERQRVAVAAALAPEPPLLLADEPTGNLDLETGRQVMALLDDLVRREGRTLVMATHSLDVMGIANRVLRVEDGQLREMLREATP
jgi:putative ABC transport system ATP-binding protein